MSLDSYITLGRSGLKVSPFCLGTMTFGEDLGWGASPEDSEAMIAEYLDRGGNFIDTANVYTNGHAEKIIGDFFAKSDARSCTISSCQLTKRFSAAIPNSLDRGSVLHLRPV
jgi:aryl-alcohol dehydrogenase-like predicted oxidoreductase